MNNQVIRILTGIGELQSDPAVLNNEKLQQHLASMKMTTQELFNLQGRMNQVTVEGYRKDAIGQMEQLGEMIASCRNGVHDRALFDIGLAAENLARRIQHMFEVRNQAGLEVICQEMKQAKKEQAHG